MAEGFVQNLQGPAITGNAERRISDYVWKNHEGTIRFKISVSAIFKHLVAEEIILLTDDAAERYVNAQSESEQKEILVDCVPKSRHDDYLNRFIRCLKESEKEAGKEHKDLADLLEREYSEAEGSDLPDLEPNTDVSTFREHHGQPFSVQTGCEAQPTLVGPSSPNKCFVRFKANWKWVVVYTSSLVWLLLALLAVVIVTHVPKVHSSHPIGVVGAQRDAVLKIDLGVHPFWLSSATIAISPAGCTGRLYMLTNSDCSTLPIVVQEFNQLTLVGPPYFLLEGSTFNVTIAETVQSGPDGVLLAYIQSRVNFIDCSDISTTLCSNPSPEETFHCQFVLPGNTPPLFTAESSDYYTFCASSGLFDPLNRFTLNWRRFNATALREQYNPTVGITTEPWTADFNQPFDFNRREYCLLLDVGRPDCVVSIPPYNLEISVHRRQDITAIIIIVGVFLFLVHLSVSIALHCYRYRKTHSFDAGS